MRKLALVSLLIQSTSYALTIPASPASRLELASQLSHLNISRATTLTTNLDPNIYPPPFPFNVGVFEHPELSSNGGHLFSHLVRDFVYIWSLSTNARIRRSVVWLDPSFPISTSISLMPDASPHPAQQLDLRSLGYILEGVAGLYLHTTKWGCAVNVQVHRLHAPSPGNGLLDIYIKPQTGPLFSSTNATLLAENDVKIDLDYTGIGITRRTICALFYDALKAVCRMDYDAICPRSEEIGIARLVSPDNGVVMQITVLQRPPPGRPMLMGQLGAALYEMLRRYAAEERWEGGMARVRLGGVLVATMSVGRLRGGVVGDGRGGGIAAG